MKLAAPPWESRWIHTRLRTNIQKTMAVAKLPINEAAINHQGNDMAIISIKHAKSAARP